MQNGFTHQITIRKEALKFSSAHFTVFPDGTKEALHGHNYRTQLDATVAGPSLGQMVPFALLKAALRDLCGRWDEKVLLPSLCPHVQHNDKVGPEQTEFTACGKFYSLPTDEVVWLKVDNITTESLACEGLEQVLAQLMPLPEFERVGSLSLRVEEITGQGASCTWTRS